jgi:hypothetical protein
MRIFVKRGLPATVLAELWLLSSEFVIEFTHHRENTYLWEVRTKFSAIGTRNMHLIRPSSVLLFNMSHLVEPPCSSLNLPFKQSMFLKFFINVKALEYSHAST